MNKEAGTKALTTETGAGQWGSALAMACSFFDMALEVYMVKVSYFQKPYRRIIMENFGATVFPSPSHNTHFGSDILPKTPIHPARSAWPSRKRSRRRQVPAALRNTRSAQYWAMC